MKSLLEKTLENCVYFKWLSYKNLINNVNFLFVLQIPYSVAIVMFLTYSILNLYF